jgi:hypothetical protein
VKVRYAALGVALSVAGLGLTGCGNGTDPTGASAEKIDVQQSAAWMEDVDALQYTFSIAGEPAAVKAFAATGEDDGKISADDEKYLDLLTSAKIIVVGEPNNQDSLASVVIQLDGADLISKVTGKDDLYLKADADKLPPALGSELEKSGASLTQVAGMLDMFAPGSGDVLRNKWVHLNLSDVYDATGQTRPTPDAAMQAKGQKLIEDLLAKVVVTPDAADPAHRVATVKGEDLKAAVKGLYSLGSQAMGTGAGSAPSLEEFQKALDDAKFPAETKVDLYFDGEKLIKVGVDVTQFDPETAALKQPVSVEISFAEAAPVTAPTDAKNLDLTKLMDNFKSMLGDKLKG